MGENILDMARRHVAEGEERVAQQRDRILELERDGHNTTASYDLLRTLEETLEVMRDHLHKLTSP